MSKIGKFFHKVGTAFKDGGKELGSIGKSMGLGALGFLTGGMLGGGGGGDSSSVSTLTQASLTSMLLSSGSSVTNGMSGGKQLFSENQDEKDWEEKKERHRHQ